MIGNTKKYKMLVEWVVQKEIIVEASSLDEAEEKAMDIIPIDGFINRIVRVIESSKKQ